MDSSWKRPSFTVPHPCKLNLWVGDVCSVLILFHMITVNATYWLHWAQVNFGNFGYAIQKHGMDTGATSWFAINSPQANGLDLQQSVSRSWVRIALLHKSLAETTIWGSCPPVTKVYQCRFWMMLHGSGSAKPTVCYSNMREIEALDLGPLRKEDREQNTTLRTTRNLKAIPCCSIYCPWECFSIAPQLLPCCLLRTIHRQQWSQALSRHSWVASFTVSWLLRWRIWVICWGIIDPYNSSIVVPT